MTGKQRALNMLVGTASLFGGGALIKMDFELGPLLGSLLLLYGTVGLVCSLTAPGEEKKIGNASQKAGFVDKIIDADGPKYGCLLLAIIIGIACAIGCLERNSEKFGFSIVGVIIVGLIFFGIDKLSKK